MKLLAIELPMCNHLLSYYQQLDHSYNLQILNRISDHHLTYLTEIALAPNCILQT